jgi:S1-C subfamily serine protease
MAMAGWAQGICFAIGIDTAAEVASCLMREGRVRRSRLRLAAQTVTLERRVLRELERTIASAVMVLDTDAEGPAARAGLCKGDVILEFGGEPVSGVDDLHRLLIGDRAGRAVSTHILRAGRPLDLSVTPEPDA